MQEMHAFPSSDSDKTCDQILDLNGHGKCVGNFTRKSHVYCSCDYGWRLLGAKKLKCRSKPDARWTWTSQGYDSHNWSLPVPTCVGKFLYHSIEINRNPHI